MQEIRDFIYGKRYFAYLYGMPLRKHTWKHVSDNRDITELTKVAARVMKDGEYHKLHVSGGIFNGRDDIIVTPPTEKLFNLATDPRIGLKLGDNYPPIVFSMWGVQEGNDTWVHLGAKLPTLVELQMYKLQSQFSSVRICRYTPSILCLETCEMYLLTPPESKPREITIQSLVDMENLNVDELC